MSFLGSHNVFVGHTQCPSSGFTQAQLCGAGGDGTSLWSPGPHTHTPKIAIPPLREKTPVRAQKCISKAGRKFHGMLMVSLWGQEWAQVFNLDLA